MQAEPPTPERRQDNRRRVERRRSDRRAGLIQEPGPGGDETGRERGLPTVEGESVFVDGLPGGEAGADSRLSWRRNLRAGAPQDSALTRIYRAYAAARAVVGLVLVALQAAWGVMGVRVAPTSALVCLVYATLAITLWMLPRFRVLSGPQQSKTARRLQWTLTIGADLVAFVVLHLLESGSSFNYAALLVLPVLMAGVLTSRLSALATAAGVTLALLTMAGYAAGNGADLTASMMQAGLAGLGLFVIALLSGELAGRLAREEQAARGSLELARQQAQLNRLVIEDMVDGVLVVDQKLRVRAANPAARTLLSEHGSAAAPPFSLLSVPAWQVLASTVEAALADPGQWPEAGRDIGLSFEGGHRRTLRVRMRFMRRRSDAIEPGGAALPFCVLLLEDVRSAEARLRQEKLAAMGRVSAGIAHEIRNPLAAISQANALLLEDELAPTQVRLARIVADNVQRLKRIVDDVMEVAPGPGSAPRAIDATAEVATVAAEWARTVDLHLGADSRLHVDLPLSPLGVSFDPEHLRRVLVNLLDNAKRHASGQPGSIGLRLAAHDERTVVLCVESDSEPIPPEVERYLFEPFFSTRSRGTGLGLYICREICERYGASIEFHARPAQESRRNEFRVTLQRAELSTAEESLGLTT